MVLQVRISHSGRVRFLIVALCVLLSACAPRTETLLEPPRPASERMSGYFAATAELNGTPVQLTTNGNLWALGGVGYVVSTTFSPDRFERHSRRGLAQFDEALAAGAVSPFNVNAASLTEAVINSGPRGFKVGVNNVSDDILEILWEGSAIILPDGSSSPVFTPETPLGEFRQLPPAVSVAPGGKIETTVFPYLGLFEQTALVRNSGPLIQNDTTVQPAGTTVALFLTLRLGERQETVRFEFVQHDDIRFVQ